MNAADRLDQVIVRTRSRPHEAAVRKVHDYFRSAAQLTAPDTELFVARSRGDYISYAEPHGPDPAGFADAFRFETGDCERSLSASSRRVSDPQERLAADHARRRGHHTAG